MLLGNVFLWVLYPVRVCWLFRQDCDRQRYQNWGGIEGALYIDIFAGLCGNEDSGFWWTGGSRVLDMITSWLRCIG